MHPEHDLLTRTYDAFNARDIDAVLALMHPDVDWPNGWEGGRIHGHQGVRDYWTRQWAAINPHVEPVSIESDDLARAVVEVHATVRDLTGSVISEGIVQHIYVIEGGLIRSMEIREGRELNGQSAQNSMSTPEDLRDVQIVQYREEYAPDFARLNLEWLQGYSLLEEADLKYLENPKTRILDGGGEIFFALDSGNVIGTCAAIRQADDEIELAKLAVSPAARGQGLGRRLSETVIQFARKSGVKKVVLSSSTKLVAAVQLYESLGFRHAPIPSDISYETADVYMELDIGTET